MTNPVTARALRMALLACLAMAVTTVGSPVLAQDHSVAAPQLREPPMNALVTLDAKRTTLLNVLETLMKQADANYTLDSRLQDTGIGAVRLRNVPFRVALDTIIRASNSPATFRLDNGILMIVPREPEGVAPVAAAGAGTQRVSVDVDQASLYSTLHSLFSQAHADFTLDPALKNVPVTVHVTSLPMDAALQSVLRAAPQPLTYRIENGVYSVVPRAIANR